MKAIMYHYVREFDPSFPNFRFLDIKNFRKQLDFFEKEYGFVTKDEWDTFTSKGILPVESGKVVLTFDDAMHCHFDFVFHELRQRGLWGIFYVPTLPYVEEKILDVHRIHLLCGAFDGVSLFQECMSLISEEMITDSKIREFREETYLNQVNHEGIDDFKRLLNYYIDYEFRESILDEIYKTFDFKFDPKKFYVTKDQLVQMDHYGMVIGSHSSAHPLMSKLEIEEQRKEITDSFSALTEIGVCSERTYCHPYGGFISFNSDTIKLLDECGVLYSFNVEPREIITSDFVQSRQFLPRFDCNLFHFGKAS
jgi:peptidoglycan/xylan/chitin deacetylase (PgdA/CDA1 family)